MLAHTINMSSMRKYTMSKSYVKDENGKYHLVDKQEPKAHTLTLQELDARLKRVERIVIDPRK